jgi:hypothetical protein
MTSSNGPALREAVSGMNAIDRPDDMLTGLSAGAAVGIFDSFAGAGVRLAI